MKKEEVDIINRFIDKYTDNKAFLEVHANTLKQLITDLCECDECADTRLPCPTCLGKGVVPAPCLHSYGMYTFCEKEVGHDGYHERGDFWWGPQHFNSEGDNDGD